MVSISCAQYTNLALIGDFNIDVSIGLSPMYTKLCCLMASLSLSQIVKDYTHLHHNGSASTIDLLFVSDPHLVCGYQVLPPLSTSNHNGILATLKLNY